MKKTYIKPQATVVAMEDKSYMLMTSYYISGKSSSDVDETMSFGGSVSGTSGLSKRNGGGLWDDDEE